MGIVNITPAPNNLNNTPQAFFKKSDFDATIHKQGYDIIYEKAIRCGCQIKGGQALPNCLNCGGSSWFFINKTKTKAILHSMNLQTQRKDWSEVNLGNVNIAVRDVDKLSFMDRISVINSRSLHTQVAYSRYVDGSSFVFLDYEPKEIETIFLFDDVDKPHHLLGNNDYEIVDDKLVFKGELKTSTKFCISIRFFHETQYHVLDLPRDVMIVSSKDINTGKITKVQMPVTAVGRRAHYVLNRKSFIGDKYIDNSYLPICSHD